MVRLDQNRAMTQLAQKAGVPGHRGHQPHHLGQPLADDGPRLRERDDLAAGPPPRSSTTAAWLEGDFLATVQQRGKAIIDARGASSAASAANALIDHVRNWCGGQPTPDGEWVSMAVPSDGSYGVPEGLISGFPVRTDGKGGYEIVQGIELSDGARAKLDRSVEELSEEREAVSDML